MSKTERRIEIVIDSIIGEMDMLMNIYENSGFTVDRKMKLYELFSLLARLIWIRDGVHFNRAEESAA